MDIVQIIRYLYDLVNFKLNEVIFGFSLSLFITAIFNKISKHIEINELEMPIILLTSIGLIAGFFIIVDLIFGIIAAKTRKEKITSEAFGKTVAKFTAIVLYIMLALFTLFVHYNLFVASIIYTPLVLSILKEYISIGENIFIVTGTKYYMFILVDNMFEILQLRFINKIKKGGDTFPPIDDENE